MAEKMKKVKIARPIIVDGKHAAVGEVHTVPHNVALDLIGSGSAVEHSGDGGDDDRAETAQHGDPSVTHGDPATKNRSTKK